MDEGPLDLFIRMVPFGFSPAPRVEYLRTFSLTPFFLTASASIGGFLTLRRGLVYPLPSSSWGEKPVFQILSNPTI